MDRRSALGVAAGLLAGLAGCSAFGGDAGDGSRTVAPDLRGTPAPTPTPTATPTATPTPPPYAAEGADRLDRPRDVILTNQRLDEARVGVRLRDGGTTVLETAEAVPGAGAVRLTDVLVGAGTYDVTVRTADGRTASFAWTADAASGDLGADLDVGVTPRDRYRGAAAAELVEGDTASLVGDGQEGSRPLVVDNGGPARTVAVALANGEGFAGLQVAVPADSRVRLPLAVRERTVRVVASVDGAEDRSEWRPLADGALYVAADGPRLLCDLLRRPLAVTNRTDAARRVTVGIADGTGERFESGFRLEPNERAVRQGVVGPAGSYEIRVETGDRVERYSWDVCPPVGPVSVWVDDDGIDVSVRPTLPGWGSETGTETGTETDD
ncbi:hypothetical protein [Candidatus Halobonum tyrrellensis]|uniref:Ig-like domain-containing protein n=1 Tax=Candidatus Halobonum tyrrellensis G22 TaxID=1324957 RepID=V4GTJ3_9EURY|nr:hypothetical protein [Candidatus Halobonum tyrrellensis]ESP88416.1 hypothetical protein K933_08152 [Candidatus Halobonum tyrrellensis G22]